MSETSEASGRTAMQRLMRPASVAIVGMSSKPGTVGHQVLRNLVANQYRGKVRLVGRGGGEIDGVNILKDMSELEEGIDVAVLTLPAAGVEEALKGCIARKVGVAVVFASGFAELGDDARAEQNRLRALVREAGLSVIGPNCLGYTNYNDGFMIGFVNVVKIARNAADTRGAVAIVGQSGSVQAHLAGSLISRGVDVSFSISTGNQMDLGFGDFIQYLLEDASTGVVAVYAEHIDDPESFLAAARTARQMGKSIVLLHPGRSAKAQAAARSHTGAMASNYAVMRAKVEREGVIAVDSLDEFLDVSEILSRFPQSGGGAAGLGIATFSGAFCGVAQDFCEAIDADLPGLSADTITKLKAKLPAYAIPANPLDLGTQPIFQHSLVHAGVEGLLADPAIGGVVVSIPPSSPANGMGFLQNILQAKQEVPGKPLAVSVLYDNQPLPEAYLQLVREKRVILSRSSDRCIRAMAKVLGQAKRVQAEQAALPVLTLPKGITGGTQPEWLGKKMLAAAGIAVPQGELARTVDEAVQAANRTGYPVALKAQSARLEHKTEAGGVILNISDAGQLAQAWEQLQANIKRTNPSLTLDGVLVERMSVKGVELVIGARRDPDWGTVVLVGMGGVMVEAMQDVRLLVPGLADAQILAEIGKLRASRLLHGFRDITPRDLGSIVQAVRAVEALMASAPRIREIDINPLMVHADGQGATALDALFVFDPE